MYEIEYKVMKFVFDNKELASDKVESNLTNFFEKELLYSDAKSRARRIMQTSLGPIKMASDINKMILTF